VSQPLVMTVTELCDRSHQGVRMSVCIGANQSIPRVMAASRQGRGQKHLTGFSAVLHACRTSFHSACCARGDLTPQPGPAGSRASSHGAARRPRHQTRGLPAHRLAALVTAKVARLPGRPPPRLTWRF